MPIIPSQPNLLPHIHVRHPRPDQVVGVDGVRKAAEDFVQEHRLTSEPPARVGGLELLELHRRGGGGPPVRFVLGDFFRMRPEVAGTFEVRPPAKARALPTEPSHPQASP